jgi:predicted XRE-type DNA-binding protein
MKENSFPSEKKLQEMLKKLEHIPGSAMLPPDASATDRFRFEVCEKILIWMKAQNWTQRKLAKKLKIDEARVSEIVHYRIDRFSTDKLLEYYERLNPKADFKVA